MHVCSYWSERRVFFFGSWCRRRLLRSIASIVFGACMKGVGKMMVQERSGGYFACICLAGLLCVCVNKWEICVCVFDVKAEIKLGNVLLFSYITLVIFLLISTNYGIDRVTYLPTCLSIYQPDNPARQRVQYIPNFSIPPFASSSHTSLSTYSFIPISLHQRHETNTIRYPLPSSLTTNPAHIYISHTTFDITH